MTSTPTTPGHPATRPASTHRATATFCALVALSAYAGAVGLVTQAIAFGSEIESRLPWRSYPLAAVALTACVAVPMTVAAVTAWRGSPAAPAWTFLAGVLQIVWIGGQLAVIQAYSPFQPIYLGVGVALVGLAWSIRDDSASL